MSGRRGRNQARRKGGNGMPGWAWLAIGLVLGAVALWGGTSLMDRDHDFLKPQPNPDARPAPASNADDGLADATDDAQPAPADEGPDYDFYTLLPEKEVVIPDAELDAQAQAETEARARAAAAPKICPNAQV